MKRGRIALITIVAFVVAMQFFRPRRNESGIATNDISKAYNVPIDIKKTLEVSCYDCHSNFTKYPWYANVQPMGWLLSRDIQMGKEHLNFSELRSYSARVQISKLREIRSTVTDGSMPLRSYLFLHRQAKLSQQQKAALIRWSQEKEDSLKQII